jgi:hypothetical protein
MPTNTASVEVPAQSPAPPHLELIPRLSIQQLVDPVVMRYYPNLLGSVHACLAVFGTLALKDRRKPLSLSMANY